MKYGITYGIIKRRTKNFKDKLKKGVDLFFKVPTGHFSMIIYKLVTRVLFVPFVAGLSYEIQRWTSYHLDNIFAKMIAVPGMWLQKITTREPDESQLEVAIVALNVALGNEVPNATEVFE